MTHEKRTRPRSVDKGPPPRGGPVPGHRDGMGALPHRRYGGCGGDLPHPGREPRLRGGGPPGRAGPCGDRNGHPGRSGKLAAAGAGPVPHPDGRAGASLPVSVRPHRSGRRGPRAPSALRRPGARRPGGPPPASGLHHRPRRHRGPDPGPGQRRRLRQRRRGLHRKPTRPAPGRGRSGLCRPDPGAARRRPSGPHHAHPPTAPRPTPPTGRTSTPPVGTAAPPTKITT